MKVHTHQNAQDQKGVTKEEIVLLKGKVENFANLQQLQ